MSKIVLIIEDVNDTSVNFRVESDPPLPELNADNFDEVSKSFTPAQKVYFDLSLFLGSLYGDQILPPQEVN